MGGDVKKTLSGIEADTKASNKRISDSEKQKSKEVLAIEAETVKQKKDNQKTMEAALRSRIQAELKLEKELNQWTRKV